MLRAAFVTILTLCFVVSAQSQTVTVLQEAKLFIEPDERGDVRATLPAGVELTVVAEQNGWLAVSTQTGIPGWILRALVSDIDEGAPEPRQEATPEPRPTVETPPDPQTEPSREPEPSAEPEPAPVREERVTPDRDAPRITSDPEADANPGGFYNLKKWWGVSVGFDDGVTLPGAEFGLMIHRMVGVRLLASSALIDAGGGTAYRFGGGASVDIFGLQPNERLPIGIFGTGRFVYDQVFDNDFNSEGAIMTLAGDVGVYGKFGSNAVLIPKAAVRFVQNTFYVNGNKLADISDTQFFAGLDVRIGSIVPGASVIVYDGGQTFFGSVIVGL